MIDLSFSKIQVIENFAFDGNQKLHSLTISGNSIGYVPNLFISSNNSLRSINANSNKINMLESENISHLLYLSIDRNLFNEEEISGTMSNLPNLRYVSIDFNKLEFVHRSTFINQQKIQFLSLWKNNIQQIQAGSFDHMTMLETLNLEGNENLKHYITESWHFCNSLTKGSLDLKKEYFQKIQKDLKVDEYTEKYCENDQNYGNTSVEYMCTNFHGNLNCQGNIEDLLCELKEKQFLSITFPFPKDTSKIHIDNFHEAESNSYFKDINGNPNMTKYLSDLELYGTKFDLTTLGDYVGQRTKNVTVYADTVFMSGPLTEPIHYMLSVRARVVSITEDIHMNMTREQFFENLPSFQPVDNWALVEDIVTGVGNSSFYKRKQGFIEVQRARFLEPKSSNSNQCYPRYFSVKEYEEEHKTPNSVFFNRIQLNLLRVAVKTLASTITNKKLPVDDEKEKLAIDMADHALSITAIPNLVTDRNVYIAAQKLIQDKAALLTHSRNVPFFAPEKMGILSRIMFDEMKLYKENETMLLTKLELSLGSISIMNRN